MPEAVAVAPTTEKPAEPVKPLSRADRMAQAVAKIAIKAQDKPPEKPADKPADPVVTPKEVPAVEPPKPAEEQKASKRYADIARREGELVAKQRAFKAKEGELNAKLARADSIEQALKKVEKDPLGAAKALGLTLEQLSKAELEGKTPPELEVRAVRAELSEWKTEQKRAAEEQAKTERARMETEAAEARTEFQAEVSSFIDTNSASYPLTKIRGGAGVVAAIVEENFKRTKQMKSVKDATEMAEKWFRQQRETEDAALGKAKPAETAAPKLSGDPTPAAKPQERTSITVDLAAGTPSSFVTKPKAPSDYRARALARLDAIRAGG